MNKSTRIRIGTRGSELALWQAGHVKSALEDLGYDTIIIPIKSTGDIELTTPLYEMGVTGIFTKHLDAALLDAKIDIAVHSMKDVPTALPSGIVQAAVLARANVDDILVYRDADNVFTKYDGLVATGSLRRKAQWLNRHPKHEVVGLRGNVNTRLQKLESSKWNGAIFARAGLERLGKLPKTHMTLDWMIPAPAQGAVMICARQDDEFILGACAELDHEDSALCTQIERDFLRTLEGGCTAPIGALATLKTNRLLGDQIEFTGILLSRDGQQKFEINKTVKRADAETLGEECAEEIIAQGGKDIMAADAESAAKQAARKAQAQTSSDTKKRAQAGAKKKDKAAVSQEPKPKRTRKPSGAVTLVSTRKLTEVQIGMVRKTIRLEDLDFIKTVFKKIPPEAVRTDSMIITSQASVWSLLASFPRLNLKFKNIYCVGSKTTIMVEERLGRVLYTAPSSRELAQYLAKNMSGRAITYFCSTLRRDELPDILAQRHIKVTEIPAYETKFMGHKIDGEFDGVLFYSPSGVRSYVQANSPDKVAFCIGDTTAHEARTYFKDVHTAKHPTIEHVLQLVNTYYG